MEMSVVMVYFLSLSHSMSLGKMPHKLFAGN